MDLTQGMDAELTAAYQGVPVEGLMDWDDLPATRELFAGLLEELTAGIPDSESVLKEDRQGRREPLHPGWTLRRSV